MFPEDSPWMNWETMHNRELETTSLMCSKALKFVRLFCNRWVLNAYYPVEVTTKAQACVIALKMGAVLPQI